MERVFCDLKRLKNRLQDIGTQQEQLFQEVTTLNTLKEVNLPSWNSITTLRHFRFLISKHPNKLNSIVKKKHKLILLVPNNVAKNQSFSAIKNTKRYLKGWRLINPIVWARNCEPGKGIKVMCDIRKQELAGVWHEHKGTCVKSICVAACINIGIRDGA